mmetsp:Transcript_64953/g.174177  ORF Transcript_64953/g.174177 Transcript_64953/m.174177 type:complete len:141 (+) Transcript_64953:49-471(+)
MGRATSRMSRWVGASMVRGPLCSITCGAAAGVAGVLVLLPMRVLFLAGGQVCPPRRRGGAVSRGPSRQRAPLGQLGAVPRSGEHGCGQVCARLSLEFGAVSAQVVSVLGAVVSAVAQLIGGAPACPCRRAGGGDLAEAGS